MTKIPVIHKKNSKTLIFVNYVIEKLPVILCFYFYSQNCFFSGNNCYAALGLGMKYSLLPSGTCCHCRWVWVCQAASPQPATPSATRWQCQVEDEDEEDEKMEESCRDELSSV